MWLPTAFKKMTKSLIWLPRPYRFQAYLPPAAPSILHPKFPGVPSDTLPHYASDQVGSPCYVYLKYHDSPFVAFNTVTILYWCCDFEKIIFVTLLTCRLYVDKGPHLLLHCVVSSMFMTCLILSSCSVKMSWMNKCSAMLMTCHLVANHT